MFVGAVGTQAIVSVQNPVVLSTDREPQPDLALLRPSADEYASRVPRSADVLLLIEVADTSLHDDRHVKLPRYAQDGIAEVWILDPRSSS